MRLISSIVLSDFQITIPELGTISARSVPHVVSPPMERASSRTRCDAAVFIPTSIFPAPERELAIIRARLPGIEDALPAKIARFVHEIRKEGLEKVPGIAETLDWAAALGGLEIRHVGDDSQCRSIDSDLPSQNRTAT